MELLQRRSVLISDGGLATELENRGGEIAQLTQKVCTCQRLTGACTRPANLNDFLWSARLLRDDPELIYETHLAYYLAGADFATTASYQATIAGFEKAGIAAADGEMLIRKSVVLARRARDAAW